MTNSISQVGYKTINCRCELSDAYTIRHEYGFTLLELLLALVLSTLLITALTVAVSSITDDWERQDRWLATELDDSLAFLQLERALYGAFPHLYRDPETNEEQLWFQGGEDYIAWVSTVSPDRRSGLSAWRLDNGEEGVTVRIVPVFAQAPDEALAQIEPRLLLPNLKMQLSYLQQDEKNEMQWQYQWSPERVVTLPRALRIDFIALDKNKVKQSERLENLHLLIDIKAWQHPDLKLELVQ